MLPPPPSPPLNSLIMHDLNPNMWKKELRICCMKFEGFAPHHDRSTFVFIIYTLFVFASKTQNPEIMVSLTLEADVNIVQNKR